jgi:acetyltransferase-like isoleucine patch superfamily enzyme
MNLNSLRKIKADFLNNYKRNLQKNETYRFYKELQKKIKNREGVLGRPGQLTGDINKSSIARVCLGFAPHLEDNINIWFSENNNPQSGKLTLGDHVFVGFGSYFGLFGDIQIGNNVLIAARAYIASVTHGYEYKKTLIQKQGFKIAPVRIGNDVWIGCNVVIMPGVTVNNGAVIGAGSVVTKNIPAFEVWGGVPAKNLRSGDKKNP